MREPGWMWIELPPGTPAGAATLIGGPLTADKPAAPRRAGKKERDRSGMHPQVAAVSSSSYRRTASRRVLVYTEPLDHWFAIPSIGHVEPLFMPIRWSKTPSISEKTITK